MAVTVSTVMEIETSETLTLGRGGSSRATSKDSDRQLKMGEASTPPMSLKSEFTVTLTGGSATVDLLALVGTQGQTLATTGTKVQAVKIKNPNAHALAITTGGSNGYAITLTVPPQGVVMLTSTDGLGDVGSSNHNLTLTGTGTEVSYWTIILG